MEGGGLDRAAEGSDGEEDVAARPLRIVAMFG
jgi:hypothetical protein